MAPRNEHYGICSEGLEQCPDNIRDDFLPFGALIRRFRSMRNCRKESGDKSMDGASPQ